MHKTFAYLFLSTLSYISAGFLFWLTMVLNFPGMYAGMLVVLILLTSMCVLLGTSLFVDAMHNYIARDVEKYE